jgi:CMP-N-acetylneuraminic acid synthetase
MGRVIAFIPVRCGSKSIKLKNIKILAGKPLIFWALDAAIQSGIFTDIVVATDCDEIARKLADFQGFNLEIYRRDPENAQDTSTTESVIFEYLGKRQWTGNEIFMLIQVTSPFIKAHYLIEALEKFRTEKADSLLTCTRIKRFIWDTDGRSINYDYRNRPRRQDFDGILIENGSFYISTVEGLINNGNRLFGKISVYEMDDERTFFEIDEESDWIVAENLLMGLKD